ncbi:MAG: molybdopterin-binding protein [Anaerolineae bacterium]
MKFGPVPIEHAEGKILGHNVAGRDGKRALRKGKPLTAVHLALLRDLGRASVYVAELEPGDVHEDAAALRVAQAVVGEGLRLSGPSAGRVNLMTTTLGVLRVDAERLARLNGCDGVTLATLSTHTPVGGANRHRKMVGTIKILPFAVPESTVHAVEQIAAEGGPLIWVDPLPPRMVALILSGSPAAESRIRHSFDPPLRARLEALNATLTTTEFVPLEEERGEIELAEAIQQRAGSGADLVVLAGETAIMDRYDIAPRAVERAGGEVTCFGAPVDPGNLLMLAYLGDVPVLGAPGCVRSRKANIVDWVLPRLLAGERLSDVDIYRLGHGGLLEDVRERPHPRSQVSAK